jgi:ribosomal protein S18 acetylase RimI-like enzyme
MAKEPVLVRKAKAKEAGLVADISRETFHESFASVNTKENMDKFMNEQFTREKLMAETKDPGNIFLLAFMDKDPVGYCKIRDWAGPNSQEDANSMEIARIYVVQKKIRCGIGKLLMHECVKIARQKGRRVIWLGVWERNTRAIEFYTKWGFKKFSEHIFMLGDEQQTDWLMKKFLD